jgi:hypothetical protein
MAGGGVYIWLIDFVLLEFGIWLKCGGVMLCPHPAFSDGRFGRDSRKVGGSDLMTILKVVFRRDYCEREGTYFSRG